MKKKILLIGVIALTVVVAFSMAACKSAEEKAQEDLKGTWKADIDGETRQITFDGNKFDVGTLGSDGKFIEAKKVSGTFEAKDGSITFTATSNSTLLGNYFPNGKANYSISGSKLTLNSTTYTKE